MPDDIYANIEIDRMGNPITEEEACGGQCEPLESGKEQNILGKKESNLGWLMIRYLYCVEMRVILVAFSIVV